ncbi:MAG TPA: serine hydrolase domain-containing protein [Flavobacterium sp.]|jgi:CubicO group peptidase (beta-lactamase class C family)
MTSRYTPQYFAILLIALFFSACSEKEKDRDFAENKAPDDTLAHLDPYRIKAPKASAAYINDKRFAIDRFIKKNWRNENESLSFLVAQNGQILYEKYQGDADKNESTKITADTPLHIASVSKVLTATAVLELIDAGKIELDQKVNTILTGFPYPEVTVKHLLNHRSGLQNYAYYFDQKGKWDKKKALTNQDILDLYIKNNVPLAFKTDKKFTYCNTNYAMLALIIEKSTGLSYPKAMKRMIFDPLGMTNTFVFEYEKDKEKIVPSYFAGGMEIALDFLDAVYGDKNIYSTPRDLLKFDTARYNPDYLNEELMKKVYVGYSFESKGEKNYGLGIRMIDWVTGQHFYFHNGWWHGNTSAYVNLKNEKVMIIALSNKFSKKPYKVRFLAKLFGDYPFKEKDELPE